MHRYLVDFDTDHIQKEYHDIIIIGSGIAGVYTALEISPQYDIAILTKETLDISNSVLAQGGIAVSLDKEDSPELHFKDTLYAGAGLCEDDSVWVLVNEAASNIDKLCRFGVNFDRKNKKELSLTREGAHSKNRIIHAGDTTGKEVCDKLIAGVKVQSNISIHERTFVVDMLTKEGTGNGADGSSCKGVLAYNEDDGQFKLFMSDIIVCATGGFGQLYHYTTNPEVATGDGVCMAYRAGAELMDLEFIQFHPTVLYHPQNKSFLISEAVRGEGALLRNIHGERFMPQYHELNELAPRDVVSRAIFEEMKKTRSTHVYLDITFKDKEYLENRFPNIYKTCLSYGIDISKDLIPVAPAEHYCMGGIRADVNGQTNISGFFACGECACNGIHGANRLASNSLLEGLVFGQKIAAQINHLIERKNESQRECSSACNKDSNPEYHASYNSHRVPVSAADLDREAAKSRIQKEMTENVGIIRNKEGLQHALFTVTELSAVLEEMKNESLKDFELQNIALLSRLVTETALEREESRGAHYRSDFSKTDDEHWKKHIIRSAGRLPD